MAQVEKFTDNGIIALVKHNSRTLTNDSNKDIVPERTKMNYSISLNHGGLSDIAYYKKIVAESYLYGRGTKSEDDAITSFSWVITLPKEISDYTVAGKEIISYLNPEQEKAFFDGAVKFVSDRYGAENVIHNRVHYDEAGQPHIHIYAVPRKELSHDQIHYKINRKSKQPIKTESGRWEYEYKYILQDGRQIFTSAYEKYLQTDGAIDQRIPVKNFAKMSDYYDKKLSCFEVINPQELKYFHSDFAEFLRKNNLPGAAWVNTGVTSGKNISVSAMKEFKRATGMTIDEAKDLRRSRDILQSKVSSLNMDVSSLQSEAALKDQYISTLKDRIHTMEASIDQSREATKNIELAQAQILAKEREVSQIKDALSVKETELKTVQQNYANLQTRYQTLESSLTVSQTELLKAQDTIKTMQHEQTVNASGTEQKDHQIEALQQQVSSLKEQLHNVEQAKSLEIEEKNKEIERLKEEKVITKDATREWGNTSGWGNVNGWGTVERSNKARDIDRGNM